MKNIVLLLILLLITTSSCNQQKKQKPIFVNYGKILSTSDTILESFSYSDVERKIVKDDSYNTTEVKYRNCRYYYSNDTLILDFGESNWLKNYFKIRIHKNSAIVDLKMPKFWDKEYETAENIDSIFIKLDTLKKETRNRVKVKLYMKRHFPIYWQSIKKEFMAFEIFDDTCILKKE